MCVCFTVWSCLKITNAAVTTFKTEECLQNTQNKTSLEILVFSKLRNSAETLLKYTLVIPVVAALYIIMNRILMLNHVDDSAEKGNSSLPAEHFPAKGWISFLTLCFGAWYWEWFIHWLILNYFVRFKLSCQLFLFWFFSWPWTKTWDMHSLAAADKAATTHCSSCLLFCFGFCASSVMRYSDCDYNS